LEDRLAPAVTYHGGPLIPKVEAENVFYGSVWSNGTNTGLTTTMGQLNTFAGMITNSLYMDQLKEL
jgi:hypothetical protein